MDAKAIRNQVNDEITELLATLGDVESCGGIETGRFTSSLKKSTSECVAILLNLNNIINSGTFMAIDILDKDDEFPAELQPIIRKVYTNIRKNTKTRKIYTDVLETIIDKLDEKILDDEEWMWS